MSLFNKNIPIHFVFCIERTGSSMLSAMLNSHPDILSSSEEPFALYLYHRYRNKSVYSEKEIETLIEYFKLTSEKNLELYFSSIDELRKNLILEKDNLPFEKLIRIFYLHFLPLKPKDNITHIIDKQIKYILYIDEMLRIFPNAKFCILIRDYHDVVASWRKRGLASGGAVAYISSIWNFSYAKAYDALQKYPDKIKLLKYEDLVSDPKGKLKELANFFEFTYSDLMINHHKNFADYIDSMRSKVSEDFLKRLQEFHSNTLSPVTNELIGDWKNRLTEEEINCIESICGNTGEKYGYSISKEVKSISFSEQFAAAQAIFNKNIYLDAYVRTPLFLKAQIKKIRPNKRQE